MSQKWSPALVILLSCSKVMVMHSHELVTAIYVPISSCVSPNGSVLHPRSSNFLSINRFELPTADREGIVSNLSSDDFNSRDGRFVAILFGVKPLNSDAAHGEASVTSQDDCNKSFASSSHTRVCHPGDGSCQAPVLLR